MNLSREVLNNIITLACNVFNKITNTDEFSNIKFFYLDENDERINIDYIQAKALILFSSFIKYDFPSIFSNNYISLKDFCNEILIEKEKNNVYYSESLYNYFHIDEYLERLVSKNEFDEMLSICDMDDNLSLNYREVFLRMNEKYCEVFKKIIQEKLHKDYGKLVEDFENLDELEEQKQLSFESSKNEGNFFSFFDTIFGLSSEKEDEINYIEQIGTNLNGQKYAYDPAIGRDEIIKQIAITLSTPNQSAMIIGPAGVGKTAIAKGLAYRINKGKFLRDKKIIELDTSSLVSGKEMFGAFEENIQKIVKTLEKNPEIILFIDEIHRLYKMGINESNAMNNLKRPISEGKVRIIGATTKEEFEDTIKEDSAFVDRFDTYTISELSDKYLKQIIESRINYLEEYYNIAFYMNDKELSTFIDYLLKLTSKNNRKLNQSNHNPRLVIQLLDKIFATAKINEHITVEYDDILSSVVSNNKISNKNYKIPNIFEENEEPDSPKTLAQVIDFSSYKRRN